MSMEGFLWNVWLLSWPLLLQTMFVKAKECYLKCWLFLVDMGKHLFLLYMIVALKQGKLAINKSGLEIRIFVTEF